MGCAASKKAVAVTPAFNSSGISRNRQRSWPNRARLSDPKKKKEEVDFSESDESERVSSNGTSTLSFRLGNLQRYIEGEQVAAGWPSWLSSVAGEAIQGWVPLKAESFEKLEKIGQGTYSSVFKARDHDTGKIVALKEVKFDNFDPESVRFMAREIQILRRLDHPNVVKLEGLITSQSSRSMHLVFAYMEHDLAGLSSCPDIKFSGPQVKCYMKQLLSGLEHCHLRGIMHRDIKGANLLVNNEGLLKIADFGLANFFDPRQKEPLTSRVVTLWYRAPELLLGSTDYGATVDLWSVGCVFAELLLGKPLLQGRTEIEQLHKIIKLCGSPTDEYWNNPKLPRATSSKPPYLYKSCFRETLKGLPESAFSLLENLLSVEPDKRGTATTALASKYFTTKPHACQPLSLPEYPPNKVIDAKKREELRRESVSGRGREAEGTRRPTIVYGVSQKPNKDSQINTREALPSIDGDPRLFFDLQPMPAIFAPTETSNAKHTSKGNLPFSGPLHVTAASETAWAKRRKEDDACIRSNSRSSSIGHPSGALGLSSILRAENTLDLKGRANGDVVHEAHADPKGHEAYNFAERLMLKQGAQLKRRDSFDASDVYHPQELSKSLCMRDSSKNSILGYQDGDRIQFSGPLLSQSHKFHELIEKRDRHIRQAFRRPWLQRGTKQGE